MAEYDDTDKGALFKNLKKDSEKHPDYKGNVNVGGTDYWLSAWLRVSKDGKTYMSLAVQPKEPPVETYKGGIRQPAQRTPGEDDEIPF